MSKIVFSVSGEGRGHATRTRALVEELRSEHQISIYASYDAYNYLASHYLFSDIRIHRLPGLRFHCNSQNKMSYATTAIAALKFLKRCPQWIKRYRSELIAENPDLLITDFEPILPRVAKAIGIPFISVDHQHFLTNYDLGCLPIHLRWHAKYMGYFVKMIYQGQISTIISAFFFPKLSNGHSKTIQVGVFIRESLLKKNSINKGHTLVYFNHPPPVNVISAIESLKAPVRFYGLGIRPQKGLVEYCSVEEEHFVEDLIACNMLICSAGNQLLGEAIYLGKPVLAVPLLRFREQYINAHFLRDSGAGDWIDARDFSPKVLEIFQSRKNQFHNRICSAKLNGLPRAVEAINQILSARQERNKIPSINRKHASAFS